MKAMARPSILKHLMSDQVLENFGVYRWSELELGHGPDEEECL
jgi:hypothetical protein